MAAITKYHRPGGLSNRNVLLHGSGGWTSKNVTQERSIGYGGGLHGMEFCQRGCCGVNSWQVLTNLGGNYCLFWVMDWTGSEAYMERSCHWDQGVSAGRGGGQLSPVWLWAQLLVTPCWLWNTGSLVVWVTRMRVCLCAHGHMYSHTHGAVTGKRSKTGHLSLDSVFAGNRKTWKVCVPGPHMVRLILGLESYGIHIESTYVLISSNETWWLDGQPHGSPLDSSDYTKTVLTGKLDQTELKQVFRQ